MSASTPDAREASPAFSAMAPPSPRASRRKRQARRSDHDHEVLATDRGEMTRSANSRDTQNRICSASIQVVSVRGVTARTGTAEATMFNPTEIVIEAFVRELKNKYGT